MNSQLGQKHTFYMRARDIFKRGLSHNCPGCEFVFGEVVVQRGHTQACKSKLMGVTLKDKDKKNRSWQRFATNRIDPSSKSTYNVEEPTNKMKAQHPGPQLHIATSPGALRHRAGRERSQAHGMKLRANLCEIRQLVVQDSIRARSASSEADVVTSKQPPITLFRSSPRTTSCQAEESIRKVPLTPTCSQQRSRARRPISS